MVNESTSNIARRRAAALGDARPEYVERRREIVRAASEVFRDRGFRGTTLGHVAERMGVDRASLYYYYSSKEELFEDILAEEVQGNRRAIEAIRDSPAPAPEKLRRLIEDMMRSSDEHYPMLYVLIQENLNHVAPQHSEWAHTMQQIQKGYEALVTEIVQAGMDAGTIRADAPAWLVAYGIIGIVGGTSRWFDPGESPLTAAQIGAAFASIVLDGLTVS